MATESNCNSQAVNYGNLDGIPDFGLLQLHGEAILNPVQNIAAAYSIWTRQGYRAWTSYNSEAYLKYE